MIEVSEVRKQFGAIQALGGVSFTARDGHITALLGPNGAGKTTLLRILVGLLKRDHGNIAVDGVDPAVNPIAVRANIGFLTDQFGLYERLSTREYLAYFGELHGMGGKALSARIDEVSDLLQMDDILERRSKGFSQGQRIKVAMARTLLHRPRHLLLDEPSRGLDVMSTRALRHALSKLRDEGLLRHHGHARDAGSVGLVRRRHRDCQGPYRGARVAPATLRAHRHCQPGRRVCQPGWHR